MAEMKYVGKPATRVDALEKVLGTTKYVGDYHIPGTLLVRALRSTLPHARIVSIDLQPALKIPGVLAAITSEDFVNHGRFGYPIQDMFMLAFQRVRYAGDALAAVAAETEVALQAGLEAIVVELETLPAVFDPQAALRLDAPLVGERPWDSPDLPRGNLLNNYIVRKGDPDAFLGGCAQILDEEYSTMHQEHAYLETEGALVRAYDQDLRKKQLLGKATTDAAGHYRIAYTSRKFLRAEKTSADLYVVVLNAQHKELVSSEVLFNAPSEVVVDLTLPPNGQTLSEFEILLADILPLFKGQGKDDAELKISELEDKDIAFLSRESGQPQERIAFLLAAVKAALASPSSSGVKVKRYVSKAQNDAGEFEFSFRDGLYNPFEGAGAISSWKLSLPKNFRSFDYQTIGDVILHIDYTTEDAGEGSSFRQIVEATTSATLGALLNYFSNKPLFRVFSLRHEFPNEFHRLLHSPINTEISIKLSEKFFPIFSLGRTMQSSLAKLALGTPKNQTVRNFKISINNSERTSFTSDPLLGGLPTNQNLEALFVAGNRTELKFKLKNAGNLAPTPPVIGDSSPISPDKLLDMLIYLEYKITS